MYGKAWQVAAWVQALVDGGWTREGVQAAYGGPRPYKRGGQNQ